MAPENLPPRDYYTLTKDDISRYDIPGAHNQAGITIAAMGPKANFGFFEKSIKKLNGQVMTIDDLLEKNEDLQMEDSPYRLGPALRVRGRDTQDVRELVRYGNKELFEPDVFLDALDFSKFGTVILKTIVYEPRPRPSNKINEPFRNVTVQMGLSALAWRWLAEDLGPEQMRGIKEYDLVGEHRREKVRLSRHFGYNEHSLWDRPLSVRELVKRNGYFGNSDVGLKFGPALTTEVPKCDKSASLLVWHAPENDKHVYLNMSSTLRESDGSWRIPVISYKPSWESGIPGDDIGRVSIHAALNAASWYMLAEDVGAGLVTLKRRLQ